MASNAENVSIWWYHHVTHRMPSPISPYCGIYAFLHFLQTLDVTWYIVRLFVSDNVFNVQVRDWNVILYSFCVLINKSFAPMTSPVTISCTSNFLFVGWIMIHSDPFNSLQLRDAILILTVISPKIILRGSFMSASGEIAPRLMPAITFD